MQYLFRFGFESPSEFRTNRASDTDFESSEAVWIDAASADDALEWGRLVAEEFVRQLFGQAGIENYSWLGTSFAHWIEDEETVLSWARTSPDVLHADFGRMPDLTALVASRSA